MATYPHYPHYPHCDRRPLRACAWALLVYSLISATWQLDAQPLASKSEASIPPFLGSEFLVNTTTLNRQIYPSVESTASGDFLVLWQSTNSSNGATQAQRFATDGSLIGGELTLGQWSYDDVEVLASGDFLVAQSAMPRVHRFDASGQLLTTIDMQTADSFGPSQLSPTPDGGFAAVWNAFHQQPPPIYGRWAFEARVYGADGSTIRGPFEIAIADIAMRVLVATAADGRFVVVYPGGPTHEQLLAQRFDAAGMPIGGPILLGPIYYPLYTLRAEMAMTPGGDFAVAWRHLDDRALVSRFAADGTLVAVTEVVPPAGYLFVGRQLAFLPYGDLVVVLTGVVWTESGLDYDIFAQHIAADGTLVGDTYRVNTFTEGAQQLPSVAVQRDGTALIAWYGRDHPDDSAGVFGQRVLHSRTDLAIDVDDGVAEATPGSMVSYEILVRNLGPGNAPAVQVEDSFPEALSCSWTSTSSGGATGHEAGSGLLAQTLSMPPDSSVTYDVDCAIDPSARGTLVNSATVSTNSFDVVPENDVSTDANTVLQPLTDLEIAQSDVPDPVIAGSDLLYILEIGNSGPSSATSLVLTDTLPPGSSLLFVESDVWLCSEAGGVLSCTANELQPFETPQVRVTLRPPSTVGQVTNTVTISALEADPDSGNNTATEVTTVLQAIDVPALGRPGVTLLGLLVATFGWILIGRRRGT